MPNDNRISATLSDADKAAVLAAFQVIKTKLPFLINLTPAECQSIPTLGTTRGGKLRWQGKSALSKENAFHGGMLGW
ncbi:MAG: hypothetical protein Q8M07_11105 [Prosthecobacter sp.]|nr:hypothetical protein [Prosthecobacter sp.]